MLLLSNYLIDFFHKTLYLVLKYLLLIVLYISAGLSYTAANLLFYYTNLVLWAGDRGYCGDSKGLVGIENHLFHINIVIRDIIEDIRK